jgi:NAD(P)-dependent dehydrogenase (short-subunit alcohol dehydrogenase family)
MGRLTGRTAIVTGASQGIGRAIVDLFIEEGARVFAADLQAPPENFESEVASFFKMDVSSEAEWAALLAMIEADGSVADILINNAGTGGSQLPLEEETLAGWDRVIAVNQTGAFLGIRAVLPGMRRKGAGI